MNTELDKKLEQIQNDLNLEIENNQKFFDKKIVNNPNYTPTPEDLKLWNKRNANLDKISEQFKLLQNIANDLKKCNCDDLRLGGKKKTKRRQKRVKKSRKNKRKTRRQRVGSGQEWKPFTDAYRTAHKKVLGTESRGKKAEIEAADAEEKKRIADALQKIRNNNDYTEVNNIKDFVEGKTYVEFQGVDAKPMLKNLGVYIKRWDERNRYGGQATFEFEHGKLGPYPFNSGDDSTVLDVPARVHNVFKVNVVEEIAKYGGRKRKTKRRYK